MGLPVVVLGLSCSMVCGIFLDQGLNVCLLHWQEDSLPLSHQGSPRYNLDNEFINPNFFIICKYHYHSVQFSHSVMSDSLRRLDCSMPGFLSINISRSLLKIMSIELVMLSNHLILCNPLLLPPSILPASGSFQMSQFFASGGQNIGATVSVLPMNIQD